MLFAAATLVASAVVLVATLLIVRPAPASKLWLFGVVIEGYSLVVAGAAALCVVIAGMIIGMGAVALGGLAACFGAVALAVALVPVVRGRRVARAHDVRLSLRGFFAGPTWIGTGPTETVVFSRPFDVSEGLALDVWRPAGVNGKPTSPTAPASAAVVLVHGGGWVSGGRGGVARWNGWLADRGYVVFDVDYRLAPPPRWEDAARDVADAVAWVRAHAGRFAVDPHRVALIGWSAGGHLALLTAYRAADAKHRVQAVAAFYPITDLRTAVHGARPRWAEREADTQLHAFLGGPVADHADAARVASPIAHADKGVPPTFLTHGTNDQLVHVDHSDALAAALRHVGADHQLVRLPGSNHAFDLAWGAWSTQVARVALGRFLDLHLGPPTNP
jgi:acetyl esterase/lipase